MLVLYLQNTDTTFAIINECVTFCCQCEKQVKHKKKQRSLIKSDG